jgi:hypothetical protein
MDFIYYLSGAVAVSAEGVLPQENLAIGYNLATTQTNKPAQAPVMSNYYVFFDIMMNIVRMHTKKSVTSCAIDKLKICDIIKIRKTSAYSRFISKYEDLLRSAKNNTIIQDPAGLVLRISELEELEWTLRNLFTDTIAMEISQNDKNKTPDPNNTNLHTSISKHTNQTAVNSVRSESVATSVDRSRQKTENLLEQIYGKLELVPKHEKSIILDYVEVIRRRYISGSR